MTLSQIKQALFDGNKVFYQSENYEVIKDKLGQFLIKCLFNGDCIGLTWTDEQTMNGKTEDFFITQQEAKNV